MSILIKGMEMPTDCDNCSFFDDRFDYPSCNVTGYSRGYNWNPRGQRMPDCPIIEVPPHGRLIDADVLREAIGKSEEIAMREYNELSDEKKECEYEQGVWDGQHMVAKMVSVTPTIIPAEGGE